MPRIRSRRVSGGPGARVLSISAAARVRIKSVNAIPNRFTHV
jgi:hypothetical protein